MSVNVKIAFAVERQIKEAVLCKATEHMIEETDTGIDVGSAFAVKLKA